MADGITTLVEHKLYGLGGTVKNDGRISWLAASAGGYAPVSCYLLTEGDRATLIDAGVPAHEDVILRQLGSVLEPGTDLTVLHTRIIEFDSLGNTAAIVRAFPVRATYSQFPAHEWIHYQPKLDETSSGRDAPRNGEIDWRVLRVGESIAIDSARAGKRLLTIIAAPLRLLQTFWIYDGATKTLFTSDSFGHVGMKRPTSSKVVDIATDTTSIETVRDHLFTKFEWLKTADTTRIREQLEQIFDAQDIEMIAPALGCVLKGREVVARHYEMVQTALAEIGSPVGAQR